MLNKLIIIGTRIIASIIIYNPLKLLSSVVVIITLLKPIFLYSLLSVLFKIKLNKLYNTSSLLFITK